MVVGESSFADRTGTQFVVTAGVVAACRSVRVVTAAGATASTDPRAAVAVDCGAVPYRVSFGDRRPVRASGSDPGGRTSVAEGGGRITVSVEF
jgi:hypothetical protein